MREQRFERGLRNCRAAHREQRSKQADREESDATTHWACDLGARRAEDFL
jgi:hypothetical protein